MQYDHKNLSRRRFIEASTLALASATMVSAGTFTGKKLTVSGHLWIYASGFPPDWNSNPIIEQVFSDFRYAGMDGLELMDVNLKDRRAVEQMKHFIEKYKVPVTGTSYGANMWDKDKYTEILSDVEKVLSQLAMLGGKNFGISVGSAGRIKTEEELDTQAKLLLEIRSRCEHYNVLPNLHNHTYEVENGLHDLKGTLNRIPDFKLGPDVGWLAKAGIDPADFVAKYGNQMVYMHLRDIDKNGEWTETLGEGVIDFKSIASNLEQQSFNGSLAIELAFPDNFKPTRSIRDSWKASRRYVDKMFT